MIFTLHLAAVLLVALQSTPPPPPVNPAPIPAPTQGGAQAPPTKPPEPPKEATQSTATPKEQTQSTATPKEQTQSTATPKEQTQSTAPAQNATQPPVAPQDAAKPPEPPKETDKQDEPPKEAAKSPDEPPQAVAKPAKSVAASQGDATNRSAAGWRTIDRVVLIVNEDMLTSQTLQRDVTRYMKQSNAPKKDEANARMEIQRARVRTWLEVQAGQDMGLDVALVKAQVRDNVERLIRERFNGVAGLSDFLQSRDIDSNDLREQLKNEIYADFWDKYITGEGAVPGQRISRDRYVRPGILQLYYDNGVQHPENLEQIGGKQQEVVLQYLFIDERAQGGEEKAKNLLKTLRQRILDGEDMGELCELHSASHTAKKDRGMMQAVPEARFPNIDAAIATFLSTAKPGDVSDLLFYKTEDGQRYWRIAKLVERIAPVLPNLASPEVQQKLTQRIQDDYAALRKAIALEELFRGSYVWPTELAQR